MTLGKTELKQIFVDEAGLLTGPEFDAIVKTAGESRQPLEQMLMERGFVAPHHFLTLLGAHYKLPTTELKISEIDPEALALLPEKFAITHMATAFAKEGKVLKVALVHPGEAEVLALMAQSTGLEIEPYITTEHALKRALVLYRGSMSAVLTPLLEKIKNSDDSASVVSFLNSVMESAVLWEASDIHIEPYETEVIVRLRIDGLLKSVVTYPTTLHTSIISRLKVLSSLKVDEKRLPQDGRFALAVQDEEINIRLSLVPSMWGEKAVMRVLRQDTQLFDLGGIGLLDSDLETIRTHLRAPFGMILVTGPTGSGKTSTLYSFLQEIGTERIDVVNISTIEDPIEYTMPRVTQIQIHPEINLTFAAGLRSLLRQDPDIIMVGEIRDEETADIAVRAALVGRLLLASLHTNDAATTLPRILDMGVEPYTVSSTLRLVVSQRLVRKLCTHCRETDKPDSKQLDILASHGLGAVLEILAKRGVVSAKAHATELRFYKSKGCDKCDQTGYIGRTAVFEILEVNDEVRLLISQSATSLALKEALTKSGMKTLFADGIAKALLGVTSIAELFRIAA